jgi:lipid II:glycine glycyltransferase (peptidoglycan interpeptide bridge formation enzyme)
MFLPFTQTRGYLSWHEAVGSKTFYYEFLSQNGERYACVAAVVLKTKIGKILYCPYGPVFFDKKNFTTNFQKILNYLKDLGEKENCIFVRFEKGEENINGLKGIFSPFKKTFSKDGFFQPRVEWWKDINISENELLESFSKNHRYSVRKSQKDNVEIVKVFGSYSDYFSDFYNLLRDTSLRDGFILHEKDYYHGVFKSLETNKLKGFLLFSKVDEIVNGFVLVIVSGEVASYVFGGSTNYKRESGSGIRLQYEAMLHAKRMGATKYSFGGICENGYGRETLLGVTKYKKQFGGYVKFHGGFVDIPIIKWKYAFYIIKKFFI